MALYIKSQTLNRNSKRNIVSEINVTPLVDVMLVLLVIFMVTSPMLVAGVNVDLPETKAAPISAQDEPLVITIDKNSNIYIMETQIEAINLNEKLINITKQKLDTRIYVRGDKNVSYGAVVNLIADINNAGFTKVALISHIKHNDKK